VFAQRFETSLDSACPYVCLLYVSSLVAFKKYLIFIVAVFCCVKIINSLVKILSPRSHMEFKSC